MAREEAEFTLQKLQQLEKEQLKKKQELENLKKKIKDAEQQIKANQEFEEKVPIDQVAAASSEGMSAAEKEILASHKGGSLSKEVSHEEDEDECMLDQYITW